mmetsp:Transcript_179860/g.570510  ORF Transcript_179860/g.570510 Transcript_179860/m.570510 type:complete len:217 (+) Transcript_179860:267-917(+)
MAAPCASQPPLCGSLLLLLLDTRPCTLLHRLTTRGLAWQDRPRSDPSPVPRCGLGRCRRARSPTFRPQRSSSSSSSRRSLSSTSRRQRQGWRRPCGYLCTWHRWREACVSPRRPGCPLVRARGPHRWQLAQVPRRRLRPARCTPRQEPPLAPHSGAVARSFGGQRGTGHPRCIGRRRVGVQLVKASSLSPPMTGPSSPTTPSTSAGTLARWTSPGR